MPARPVTLPVLIPCALALLSATAAAPAHAGYRPGGSPPVCQFPIFSDRVGTAENDQIQAADRPERVYGLTGSDRLMGSNQRASCLFGGRDPDLVQLGTAGGLALGEDGPDVIFGSDKDDAMGGGTGPDYLAGGLGRDVMRGDGGTDYFDGGPGDDAMVSRDGRAEVVGCGSGVDTIAADSDDALIGCERVRRSGDDGLPLRRSRPRVGGARTTFRINFRAPAGGRHGLFVVLGNRCDPSPPEVLTQVPAPGKRVRKGQAIRLGIRAPKGGWCEGERDVVLGQRPRCVKWDCIEVLPPDPLFRIRVKVRPR